MKPVFSTERFDVFHLNCERNDIDNKDVFVALCNKDDVAAVVCTVTIHSSRVVQPYVEWVEVREQDRRQGYATEILRAIEKHLDTELVMDGASDAGDAFVESFCSETDTKP